MIPFKIYIYNQSLKNSNRLWNNFMLALNFCSSLIYQATFTEIQNYLSWARK